MILEKLESSIDSENQSSHANAAPQENAARRSSEPARVVTKVVKRAKETYIATIDSLSMSDRRFENFRTFRAAMPVKVPMKTPKVI